MDHERTTAPVPGPANQVQAPVGAPGQAGESTEQRIVALQDALAEQSDQRVLAEARLAALETQSNATVKVVSAITLAVCEASPAILELRDLMDQTRERAAVSDKDIKPSTG
jgi:uncharacterized coiled-coil protein SlyX